jgi:hypothetical protein
MGITYSGATRFDTCATCAQARLTYGQQPSTSSSGTSLSNPLGGLSSGLRILVDVLIVAAFGGAVFLVAEAARPVIEDVSLVRSQRNQRR